MLRKAGVAVLAALATGVVLGALARVLMRLVTLAAGQPGHGSWSGSAVILLVYAVAALPGCVLAAATRQRGRSSLLVVGAVLLLVPATGVASEEVTATGLSAWQWAGLLASGAAVYATVLALPVVALRTVDVLAARLPGGPPAGRVPAPRPAPGALRRRPAAAGRRVRR